MNKYTIETFAVGRGLFWGCGVGWWDHIWQCLGLIPKENSRQYLRMCSAWELNSGWLSVRPDLYLLSLWPWDLILNHKLVAGHRSSMAWPSEFFSLISTPKQKINISKLIVCVTNICNVYMFDYKYFFLLFTTNFSHYLFKNIGILGIKSRAFILLIHYDSYPLLCSLNCYLGVLNKTLSFSGSILVFSLKYGLAYVGCTMLKILCLPSVV